jgi:hypothetical protein
MPTPAEIERASARKRDQAYLDRLEEIAAMDAKSRFGKLAVRRGDRVTEWVVNEHEIKDE